MKLMILTDDPSFAKDAQDAGIDRIFFDLEYINKAERQKGRDTVLSNCNIDDIPNVRKVLTTSELLVRVNPIHKYSKDEISKAIDYGADILMLPMVFDRHDVEMFIDTVGGRVNTCVMVETSQSMARIDDLLDIKGIDEIFIGLNDLHIGLGLSFMFETLSGGLVEYIAQKCNDRNVPFGFGGIARIGEGMLPADKILGEHIRLGSQSVILSRSFKANIPSVEYGNSILKEEVGKVRLKLDEIMQWSSEEFTYNKNEIREIVRNIVRI